MQNAHLTVSLHGVEEYSIVFTAYRYLSYLRYPLTSVRSSPAPMTTSTFLAPVMLDLVKDIETPNGFKYKQPLGLFIDNEIVPSSNGQKIQAIDPAYVDPH